MIFWQAKAVISLVFLLLTWAAHAQQKNIIYELIDEYKNNYGKAPIYAVDVSAKSDTITYVIRAIATRDELENYRPSTYEVYGNKTLISFNSSLFRKKVNNLWMLNTKKALVAETREIGKNKEAIEFFLTIYEPQLLQCVMIGKKIIEKKLINP